VGNRIADTAVFCRKPTETEPEMEITEP